MLACCTPTPSSVNANAPLLASVSKSTCSFPACLTVIAAYGNTLTCAFSSINWFKRFRFSSESGTGFVFGIGHTVVNPPLAAAFVPVSIVSLCSPPGSRKWTWTSTNPGETNCPLTSMTSVSDITSMCGAIFLICCPSIKIDTVVNSPFFKIFAFVNNFILLLPLPFVRYDL
ncbi:Uncharacterised protein [Mycobacteroides abscessus subsp. abscessus]|nr:Uncharacterised protein [Mycobacteroides abscessus subsp. abscessus]